MTVLRAAILIVLLAAAWLWVSLYANERLRVQTPGRFAHEPAEWWVRVWLEPSEEDRLLRIIADGPGYQSTDRALVGTKSARVYQVWMRPALTSGCWEFRAELYASGERLIGSAVAPWPLSVSGPGTAGDVCGGPPP